MPYKLVARLPLPWSGTLTADCHDFENAIEKARGLLGQNKDFIIEVSDPEGRPVSVEEGLNADRP